MSKQKKGTVKPQILPNELLDLIAPKMDNPQKEDRESYIDSLLQELDKEAYNKNYY